MPGLARAGAPYVSIGLPWSGTIRCATCPLDRPVYRGGPDDLYDTSSGQVSAFMLDMDTVFERFVTRLAHDALQPPSPLRTAEQVRLRAVIRNDETDRTYSTLRPDLVIEDTRTGRRTPVDIKYKLYDTKKLSTADIYQAFMYAFASATNTTDEPDSSTQRARTPQDLRSPSSPSRDRPPPTSPVSASTCPQSWTHSRVPHDKPHSTTSGRCSRTSCSPRDRQFTASAHD